MIINNEISDTSRIFVELDEGEEYPPSIKYTFYGKHRRTLTKAECATCGKVYYTRKHRPAKYCSKDCQYAEDRVDLACSYCGKQFTRAKSDLVNSKSGLYFCSRECKDSAQRLESGLADIHPLHYGNGIHSYREKAFRDLPARCNHCGYDEMEKMLDVHHKDGSRENNSLDNLEILCVWCHALETRKDW